MQGIVLAGEPGSGKSSIGAALCDILGWERKSFAGPLKHEVARALAFVNQFPDNHWHPLVDEFMHRNTEYIRIRAEMDDPATKDNYRGILQWWGTEYRRAQDDLYWILQFEESLKHDGGYVVDDCRFNNEMESLRSYGFKFVLLESGATTRPVQAHASEVDWKTWDYDLVLSYEPGPEHQAQRIVEWLNA